MSNSDWEAQAPWRQMIPADRLHPNPDNPRGEVPGDLKGLESSIRENGLMQPVVARPAPDLGGGHYYIEDGWRRWLAMRSWNTAVPCVIRPPLPGENTHFRNIVVGLVTTIHSRDIGPVAKARAFGRLRDEFGLTQDQVGRQVGLSGSTVSHYLELLDLTPQTQKMVEEGKIPLARARQAVKRKRAAARQKKGWSGETGAVWEPDWFTGKHPLARKAAALCDGREHNSRRRIGAAGAFPGACGQCWESVIRVDERLVISATAEAAARWHERTEAKAGDNGA